MPARTTDAQAAEGIRHFHTERGEPHGLRYCRMECPEGVSMISTVALVPLEHSRSYFAHEIANEGRWRSGVPVIVILPSGQSDRPAPADWFPELYAQMRWAREREAPPLFRLRNGGSIDIGIIDIQIELHADDGMTARLIESGAFTAENLAFLDQITGEQIAPPMVFATALHNYHSTGKRHYHFHNLIFGLRKEMADGQERVGTIDLNPLIAALNERHDQNIVAGRKH